jgi:hypothetical protein
MMGYGFNGSVKKQIRPNRKLAGKLYGPRFKALKAKRYKQIDKYA